MNSPVSSRASAQFMKNFVVICTLIESTEPEPENITDTMPIKNDVHMEDPTELAAYKFTGYASDLSEDQETDDVLQHDNLEEITDENTESYRPPKRIRRELKIPVRVERQRARDAHCNKLEQAMVDIEKLIASVRQNSRLAEMDCKLTEHLHSKAICG